MLTRSGGEGLTPLPAGSETEHKDCGSDPARKAGLTRTVGPRHESSEEGLRSLPAES